ncbi:MAG TPA: hypothetical protein VL326_03280 [Kofleriaceae bacterium]|nr:hypothetical protein [Kofleriaceae bacterium]
MSTWVGTIIETAGLADFWDIARKHGVEGATAEIPKYVLVECDVAGDFHASVRLAEAMSRDLGATAIGFVVQTTADVHELHAFSKGAAIRRLAYSRDNDGWVQVEGTPQPWERAYFFDDAASTVPDDAGRWPDMLWDDISDEDVARYEAARRAGDASSVMDLMHPSSTVPMHRVCASFGVQPDRPLGRSTKKRSFLSRLFARGG